MRSRREDPGRRHLLVAEERPEARKAAADLDPGCDPSAVTDGEHPERRKKSLWWRVFLLAAMIVATLNVWTGSPLLALWVGSKVQGESATTLKMTAVGAVVLALAVLVFLLVRAIAW